MILVTGGTGIAGRRLLEVLAQDGKKIRASFRSEGSGSAPRFEHENIEWIEGDLTDETFCKKLCDGIETVYHFAAYRFTVAVHKKDAARVKEENIAMSRALTSALMTCKTLKHAVFMSTANIGPDEDASLSPDGYIAGKVEAEKLWEHLADAKKVDVLILRSAPIYGPHDRFTKDSNVIPSLIVQASAGDNVTIWGDGLQERSFIYVDDLITAMLMMQHEHITGTHYVSSPDTVAVKDLARIIADLINPSITVECDLSKPTGKQSLDVQPNHPILKDFAWTPLKEGLMKTIKCHGEVLAQRATNP
jgi:nucleoside-diphosphate-sugar epimerase